MDNSYSLCILCCCSFGTNSRTSSTVCREDLLNFFKVLVNSPPEFAYDSNASVSSLQSILVNSGLSICSDCHVFITSALETRSRAEAMEMNVRKLQMQILEQLRTLQKEMELFHEEMTKLESVVKSSDESCLMYHMPRNTHGVDNGSKDNGILVLRERILDVVTDLRIYQVSCTADARLPVDESEMEAMWEDAQQLVQCTPEISVDYGENRMVEHYTDSSGGGDETQIVEIDVNDITGRYVGHSVGTEFYVEGESDMDAIQDEPSWARNEHFKEDVINRALAREQTRTAELNESTDPLRRYYLKYDRSQDRLSIGNVEVIINEEEETLLCSQCSIMGKRSKTDHKKQNWRDMEKGILVHIIGKHLGGFSCLQCQEVFTSHTMIKKHVSSMHPGVFVSSVTGLASDPQPPSQPPIPAIPAPSPADVAKPSKPKKPYACSMCPSAFPKPSILKRHILAKHTDKTNQQVDVATPFVITPPPIMKPASRKKKQVQAATSQPVQGRVTINSENKVIPLKSAQRPHECHICKYAFTKRSHLTRHFDVHRKRNEMV